MKRWNLYWLIVLIVSILLLLPLVASAQDATVQPAPDSAPLSTGVLSYILIFFSGAVAGVTAVLAAVGRLKNDTAALNAIEWLGKSIPADALTELNKLGAALRDAGDVVGKVTDGQPN